MTPPAPGHRKAQPSAFRWATKRALLLLLSLLALACESEPRGTAGLEGLEYQWGESPREEAWRPVQRLSPAPPGRVGSEDLWARGRLPSETPAGHASLYLGDPLGLVEARVGDRVVYRGEPWMVRALPEASAGQMVLFHFSSSHTTKLGDLYVGPTAALTSGILRQEYDQFVIGALLAFVGILLGAASLRKPRVQAYAWFGLFSGALGLVTMGQTTLLSLLLVPSTEFWRVAQSAAIFLYPIGFVRFVETAFGDTRHRLFRWISLGLLAFLAISLVLDFARAADIYLLKRWVYPVVLITIVPIFRMMIPRARSDRNAFVFVAAFAALFVVGFPDMLRGMGQPILPFHTAHWGILAFTVGLGLVVEGRVREQQASLASYSDELSRRLVEVEGLNQELRRQIAERSKELAALLSKQDDALGAALELGPDDTFDGRYRVISRLGQGGMGAVYEVERIVDRARFALKLMTGRPTPGAAARFAREAEIAARLDHESLVGVTDVGIADGVLYLVMELVRGGSLEARRSRFGERPFALAVLRQVAAALSALHAAGVVHRDLKPANVLLVDGDASEPNVKVADFGISRLGEDSGSNLPPADRARLTATGALMGTPQYMAPELASGAERAEPAADVFAFGVMACELLTGRYPFSTPPVYAALYGQTVPTLDVDALRELDQELAHMLRRCLDARPVQRPSAADAERVLRAA